MTCPSNPATAAATPDMASPEPSTFDILTYMAQYKALVEQALDQFLPVQYPEAIYDSMRYSLLAGGKRLRPILCLTTCELLGGTLEMAMPTACALEMVHTMSLIHDDLPAMDNDDYRRGLLTNHKVFGEDMAILAGDGLLAYAFELVVTKTSDATPRDLLRVVADIGRAVGAAGLVGGQAVDLACERKSDVTLETLNFIHNHKTAALLEIATTSGAILAGAEETTVQRLLRYAQAIGLAFQITDDILDITASQAELGKSIGKDVRDQKATYPSFWGLEGARDQAQQLVQRAQAELVPFGPAGQPLGAIADFIIRRTY